MLDVSIPKGFAAAKQLFNPKMSRKAQGLSLNTIIIAVIVLIVLVILVMIFTGYTKKWGKDFGTASATCAPNGKVILKFPTGDCNGHYDDTADKFIDVDASHACCLPPQCSMPNECTSGNVCPSGSSPATGTCSSGRVCCNFP